MTTGQVAIAGSATTITSSKALAGSGTGITTGPTSATSGNLVAFTGTGGQIAALTSSSGSWTPADNSGAGLTFTSVSAEYLQVGPFVWAYFTVTYPSTASSSPAALKGLPFTSGAAAVYGIRCPQ